MRIVVILALAPLAVPARSEPLSAIELLPLPAVKGPVSLSAEPLERTGRCFQPNTLA